MANFVVCEHRNPTCLFCADSLAAVEAERGALEHSERMFAERLLAVTSERDALKADNSRLREALGLARDWVDSFDPKYTPKTLLAAIDAALAHQPKEDK